MTDSFEPPPPSPQPPEQRRFRTPPWFSAPPGTLPGIVPLEQVLARTERVAICLTRIAAYPTGFSFEIATLSDQEHEDLNPMLFDQHRLQRGPASGTEIPPELMRFGVQFSDGTKVTNTGGRPFGRR